MNEVEKLKNTEVNLLIVGATGVGKSSTVNALFETNNNILHHQSAKIGHNTHTETKFIKKYTLGKVNIWDTPGFGDSTEQDKSFYNEIETLLNQKDENGLALIDMAIVIIDASSKDLGTSIEIINNILIPNLGKNGEKRILLAINKIDLIKSGRYWNFDLNKPSKNLENYLTEMTTDIQSRIMDATDFSTTPIVYSAGNLSHNQNPYNLLVFINHILSYLPDDKRIVLATTTNTRKKNWQNNKNTKEVETTTRKIFREILRTGLVAGISSLFGGILLFDI